MTASALLLAALSAGCPAVLAQAEALGDAELAARAPPCVAALAAADAGPERPDVRAAPAPAALDALRDEADRAATAEPGDRAAAGARFRAALARHCALAAQPRLPAADAAARARAAAILAGPEFRDASADPDALARRLRALWQRVLALLETGQAQQYAVFSRALFLAAVAVAATLGALALLRRRADGAPRPAPAAAARTAAPDARLDGAEAAAARGDAASAIRLALLAALAALERDGAVPPGRSFTNRELLELLLRGGAPPERLGAARELARLFDRTVYGGTPAGAAEAAAALAAARALGSRAAP